MYLYLQDTATVPDWKKLLDAHSPHRLMYSLQIVEGLSKAHRRRRKSMVGSPVLPGITS